MAPGGLDTGDVDIPRLGWEVGGVREGLRPGPAGRAAGGDAAKKRKGVFAKGKEGNSGPRAHRCAGSGVWWAAQGARWEERGRLGPRVGSRAC